MDCGGTWGRGPGGTGAPYGGNGAGRWSWGSCGSCWDGWKASLQGPYHSSHTDSVQTVAFLDDLVLDDQIGLDDLVLGGRTVLDGHLVVLDVHLGVVLACQVVQGVVLAFLDGQTVLASLDVQMIGLAFLDDLAIGLAYQDAFLDDRVIGLAFRDAFLDDLKAVLAWTDDLDDLEVLVQALLAFLDVLVRLASLDVGLPFLQVP